MPIFEIIVAGPPVETHFVLAPDGKLANKRIKQLKQLHGQQIAHSALTARRMEYNEQATLCSDYKPMTHTVDEWAYLFHGLKEGKGEITGLIYLGQKP